MSILFSGVRGKFFSISHFISRVLWSSCFLFLAICSFQVNLRSKCSPKYFNVSTWSMAIWLIQTDRTVRNIIRISGKYSNHFSGRICGVKKYSKTIFWCEFMPLQGVPVPTKPGISLIILTPKMILQLNLKRSTFIVWEMWRHHNMRWKWLPFASRQDWTRRAIFWEVLASTFANNKNSLL
jgi:hypothetical protein